MGHGFRIRTISLFTPALPHDEEGWRAEIEAAAAFLKEAQALYERHGYEVQTVRIITRALSAATSAGEAAATAALLERLCLGAGVSFLNLGTTSSEALLREGLLRKISEVTSHTSCSFSWHRSMGQQQARQLADAIHGLAEATGGAANFRFGVAFNCPPGIPYFPVGSAGAPLGEDGTIEGGEGTMVRGFAIGTENSALLHRAFQMAAAELAASGGAASVLDAAQGCLRRVLAEALQPVEALAEQLAAATGQPYLGIDASLAPALEPPSIPAAYELLGLGRFGGAGTLAVSERITAAIKSLPLRLTGFSGLMLPLCEDSGLVAAADAGHISIGSLLYYSAVCGVGLDTVPVPGATRQQPAEEREALLSATASLLLDTAALAFRLNKPLSVRLLPVPGGVAGEQTAFDSPYLINGKILSLC
ncbi:hypothetical protein ABPG77_004910 [Micractinium sp. CCAP 211/92]